MTTITDRSWHHRLPSNRALWQDPLTPVSKIPELITRPTDNYFSGDMKSKVWSGPAYYVPSGQRQWIDIHNRKGAPGDLKPDEVRFNDEGKWVEYFRGRERPYGWNHTGQKGFSLSGVVPSTPELVMDGYTYNPFNLHRSGERARFWNAAHPEHPAWRGPRGYYGYYHEELSALKHGNRYRYPQQPCVLCNDEDLLKYEHFRNNPTFPSIRPVQWAQLSSSTDTA